MEKKEWLEILLYLRKEFLKVALIVIVASSVFFTLGANFVISKVVGDLFPAGTSLENREQILKISKELRNISETFNNYAIYPTKENRTAILSAANKLVRLAMYLTSSPILVYPLEGLLLNLKLSLIVGVAAALPYIFLVSLRVLRDRGIVGEIDIKRSTIFKYIILSISLFCVGVVYGYNMMKFFMMFLYSMAVSQGAVPLYSLSEFVSFIILMLVLFGFVFQLPIILHFLVKNEIVKYSTLKYYRRHIYVIFFIIGAITTPPDVFTQIMVAVPMVLFFELSLLFVRLTSPAQS